MRLTANRVLLSLLDGDLPDAHEYAVTYQAFGDSGAKSIVPSGISFVELGQLSITFQQ